MKPNRKILVTICTCMAMLLSLSVLGMKSEYFNPQSSTVQSFNTPFPIGTSNVPFQLKVSTVSPLPADGTARYNVLWVQIQDLYGNPARAQKGGVGVSLTSSNPIIGIVQTYVTISEGRSFTYTYFQSGYQNGTTTITAAAVGLVSSSATMVTIATVPNKLAVYVTPATVFADGGYNYIVNVELQDSSGNVCWAPYPGLGVALSSSNTTVGTVTTNIFFGPGTQFYQAAFTSTTTKGTTTITASSPGLTSGSATVKTVAVNTNAPKKLKTFLGPPQVWAFGGTGYYYPVYVQLLDTNSNPTQAPSPGVTISLTSSNPLIGTVPATMTVPTGSTYQRTYFYSTDKPGSTSIAASATGLTSSSAIMTTNGFVPTTLKIYTMLISEFADGGYNNNFINVELEDSSGRPARAATDTLISFVSSDPTVGTPYSATATVYTGTILNGIWFHSTYKKGTTTITASAAGFSSVKTAVSTVGPTPSKIGLYLAPSKVWADGRTYYSPVRIVLQDSSGNPVRAPAGGLAVTLATTNPSIGTVGSPVAIPEGSDGTSMWFRSTSAAGTTGINAYATGLTTGTATMTTVTTPSTPGPVATKLVVEGRPKYISDGFTYYDIAVSLLDASNNPVRAPATTGIGITTTSSDPNIGWSYYNFQIPQNDFYVTGILFQTTYTPGTTVITATTRNSTATITGSNTFTTGEYSPISKSYVFRNIPYLFYQNTFLVTGNATTANETMSAAVFEPGLIRAGTQNPTTTTDALLTATQKTSANLIAFSYNNTVRTSYPLGINIVQDTTWFNITATTEHLSINFTKSNYPNKSVAIVYLAKEGTRKIMYLWGYGWQGTYAAALFMSNPTNWQTYSTNHLLFLQWNDVNANKLVDPTEITVASSA